MGKQIKILLILLIISLECFGQINPGARQVALAHSDVAISDDVFALFNNPAGLSFLSKREIGFFYSPAPYGLKELSNGFAVYCEPTSYGSFSAGFMIYGFELYKETKISLGYARQITKEFAVGISGVYKNISIKNYGSKGVITFNAGVTAKITKQIRFGFSAENITRSTVSDEENQLPVIFRCGFNFRLIKDFSFNIAAQKELGYNLSLRFGTEYAILEFLQLRIGVANEPNIYSGGFGIRYQFFQVDYAVNSHPDLGLTHQFGLIIYFSK